MECFWNSYICIENQKPKATIMATIRFFIYGTKRQTVPIYARLSDTRNCVLNAKTKEVIEPSRWNNDEEKINKQIKQQTKSADDETLIDNLMGLEKHILSAYKNYKHQKSRAWFETVINQYYHVSDDDAESLNGYIETFLSRSEKSELKNKAGINYSPGTLRAFRGFQRIFNEYQGIYTAERIEELTATKETRRPVKIHDFEDITIDFYKDFVAFLSNEGYEVNTIGRFIKELKYIMRKALSDKKHSNREFMEGAFSGFTEESHAIYLTMDEIDKIYKFNKLTPREELARDAFIVLCETALRISDYRKIDVSIKEVKSKKFIYIYQSKTGDQVVIPLTSRMNAILKKYHGELPRIPEQEVNKNIKSIARRCGITEMVNWTAQSKGLKFTASKEKCDLITNHTGRRSACTNMYKAGIPVIDIMKISGHRTEKSFMCYIRITNEETAQRLSLHPYFNGLKAV